MATDQVRALPQNPKKRPTKSFTIHSDIKTAKQVFENLRAKITLGTFVFTDYFPNLSVDHLTMSVFRDK